VGTVLGFSATIGCTISFLRCPRWTSWCLHRFWKVNRTGRGESWDDLREGLRAHAMLRKLDSGRDLKWTPSSKNVGKEGYAPIRVCSVYSLQAIMAREVGWLLLVGNISVKDERKPRWNTIIEASVVSGHSGILTTLHHASGCLFSHRIIEYLRIWSFYCC
jgi:hypothetical protein